MSNDDARARILSDLLEVHADLELLELLVPVSALAGIRASLRNLERSANSLP